MLRVVVPLTLALVLAAGLAEDPTFVEAVKLYEEFNYEGSLTRFQDIALRPDIQPADKATALMWVGLCQAGAGDLDTVRRSFATALALDPALVLPPDTGPHISQMFETIRSEMVANASAPATTPPPPREPPPLAAGATIDPLLVAGGVAAGAGALALVAGGLMAMLSTGDLAKANDPDVDVEDARAAIESANGSGTTAAVLLPAGAVLAIGGGALLFLGLNEQ